MRKVFTFIVCIFLTNSLYAQIAFPLLIGKKQQEVVTILDSIVSRVNNPYVKIKKDVTKYGDIVLILDLPLNSEIGLGSIITQFYRFSPDIEICTKQFFYGKVEYAQGNLAYVKDNFVLESDNRWVRPFYIPGFEISAEFKKEEDSYTIAYELEETKKWKNYEYF